MRNPKPSLNRSNDDAVLAGIIRIRIGVSDLSERETLAAEQILNDFELRISILIGGIKMTTFRKLLVLLGIAFIVCIA